MFAKWLTLGGWLGGALAWHFAAMWLLVVNGIVYVTLGIVTGRFRRKLLPIYPGDLLHDVGAALTGKLSHDDISVYNSVQKLLYAGVLLAGAVDVVQTGSMWGVTHFLRVSALAHAFDLLVSPVAYNGNPLAHAAAAVPNHIATEVQDLGAPVASRSTRSSRTARSSSATSPDWD